MKIFKSVFFVILISCFLYSCNTLKKGFESKRKNSTDEFLIEKKEPLIMPPDFEKLPTPKKNQDNNLQKNTNKIEKFIATDNTNKSLDSDNKSNQNTENFILDKIKN
tara:strand:+ start:347 stop:667 length:321 start_codon:yes stop_codon:yes gene_type:complete